MKSKYFLFILFVCLLTINVLAQEMLLNGNFEQDLKYWDKDGYPTISQDTIFSGKKSLLIKTSENERAYISQFFATPRVKLESDFWVYPASSEYDQVIEFLADWPPNATAKILIRVGLNSDSLYCQSLDSLIKLPTILETNLWNHVSIKTYSTGEINVYINDSVKFSFFNENPIPIESLIIGDVSTLGFYGSIYYDSISVQSEGLSLINVEDIPNDQGGWVNVYFTASVYDTDSLLTTMSSSELYTVEINDGSGWMAAVSTVAYGKSSYRVLVPTTHDSTLESNGIINFRIIAGMNEGNYVSNILNGYSVDNISPYPPQNLSISMSSDSVIQLNWENNIEKDFGYYNIYRSIDLGAYELIGQETDTKYFDKPATFNVIYSYAIKASDYSGNLSGFSNIVLSTITDITKTSIQPDKFFLGQNYPNPFNPSTEITYGIMKISPVKIIIYNSMGQKIKNLVNETQNTGIYYVTWDGTNNFHQPVSAGVYYYKLTTEKYTNIKKMILVK